MAKTALVSAGKFSTRDFRDAKRAWSERLLLMAEAVPVAPFALRAPAPMRRRESRAPRLRDETRTSSESASLKKPSVGNPPA